MTSSVSTKSTALSSPPAVPATAGGEPREGQHSQHQPIAPATVTIVEEKDGDEMKKQIVEYSPQVRPRARSPPGAIRSLYDLMEGWDP
jgi:hypothetical protein